MTFWERNEDWNLKGNPSFFSILLQHSERSLIVQLFSLITWLDDAVALYFCGGIIMIVIPRWHLGHLGEAGVENQIIQNQLFYIHLSSPLFFHLFFLFRCRKQNECKLSGAKIISVRSSMMMFNFTTIIGAIDFAIVLAKPMKAGRVPCRRHRRWAFGELAPKNCRQFRAI